LFPSSKIGKADDKEIILFIPQVPVDFAFSVRERMSFHYCPREKKTFTVNFNYK
jgi:hypothetical protein